MTVTGTLRVSRGTALPLGATVTADGVNFSIFSRHATGMTLVLFNEQGEGPVMEVPLFPEEHRTGDVWHVHVQGARCGMRYAYKADGPYDPEGSGHCFQGDTLLLDPYTRAVTGTEIWGDTNRRERLGLIHIDDFDWEGDGPLHIPLKDTVIYELHVRGYTIDPSSGTQYPGTYKGLIEKIPYIKSLGITAVELLPMFEFDEMEKKPVNPKTGDRLKNFWGYGAYGFFAPKAAYATNPEKEHPLNEFKEMVKAFHREGIEVILDVVFNHTAERHLEGPTINFRGLDNTVYYAMDPATKTYVNISGCGNTFNCNHPVVRKLIIDSLHYWVLEMHVDGFRFDLATILARDETGALMTGPSLIDEIEQDPILADTKLIAEAWDMGAHQVGQFPGRWMEWNSFFRDDVRRFIRGDHGTVSALATRLAGSSDLFKKPGRTPLNGVNFVTCHDGFTLNDLVSYEKKHNEENGEKNRDGTDNNTSSNCGIEGPTDDQAILSLRQSRVKTYLTLLMVSQGIPMVLAGDEFGRTQQGNNNAYCQDNTISWVNWGLAESNRDLLRFFRMLVALRKRHPVLCRSTFLTGDRNDKDAWPDISWHGIEVHAPDWSEGSRTLAFLLNGMELAPKFETGSEATNKPLENREVDKDFFIMINGDGREHLFALPTLESGTPWVRLIDTAKPSPQDIVDEQNGVTVSEEKYPLGPSAVAVFMAK